MKNVVIILLIILVILLMKLIKIVFIYRENKKVLISSRGLYSIIYERKLKINKEKILVLCILIFLNIFVLIFLKNTLIKILLDIYIYLKTILLDIIPIITEINIFVLNIFDLNY